MGRTMIDHGWQLVLPLGLVLAGSLAQALPRVPDKAGWSGHVNLGVGAGSSETNMLAGISSIDLGDDTISSLNESAGGEDIALPMTQFEVSYTLADSRTQFYVANQQADFLKFDIETTLQAQVGIRQSIAEIGTVEFALTTSTLPIDVWKDPYQVGSARGDTERTSSGISAAWDQIFGTALEFRFTASEVELDDERSGESLPLDRDEQRLLRRGGNINRVDLQYRWELNERHTLVPGLSYIDHDLDGDAMAKDGVVLSLKHIYQQGRWRVASSLFFDDLESDKTNPIFGDENQVDRLGGSVTVFFTKPFGLENWTANATASYYDEDSSIDFYDSSFGMLAFGMLYRF